MKHTLILFFLFFSTIGHSQIRPSYYPLDNNLNIGSETDFPTNRIADDFGPRKLDDGWHGGVDYNVDTSHSGGSYGLNGEKSIIPAYSSGKLIANDLLNKGYKDVII